jgi:hypothetical protein
LRDSSELGAQFSFRIGKPLLNPPQAVALRWRSAHL